MVNLSLDEFATLESPIHRWDTRYKLIGMMTLIFAFSFIRDLRAIPLMAVITVVIYAVSRLPFSYLMTRMKYPGVFLLAMAVVLPLFSGETVLVQAGPIMIRQEGLLEFVLILSKFVCILTTGLVLFGTAPFLTSIKAMRALRLPPILADMMLLTYRYIFEVGHDLKTMEMAMRLRGFQVSRFSLRGVNTLASLSGSLLVRSYERAERIYKSMVLRGYGHEAEGVRPYQGLFEGTGKDVLYMVVMLIIAVAVVVFNVMMENL